MDRDMENQIHQIEKEAYSAVMRAFMAQADVITWDKVDLMTQLCEELRVSHDECSEILSTVKADDAIKGIREWRQSIRDQAVMLNPSHTMSNARRRKRATHSNDKGAADETLEWVAFELEEIPAADIRRVGENPSEFPPGVTGNKLPEDIEIFDTDTLIKEVELIINSSNPDPTEVELAKQKLREQEQALADAIYVVSNVTDSDEEPFPYGKQ